MKIKAERVNSINDTNKKKQDYYIFISMDF